MLALFAALVADVDALDALIAAAEALEAAADALEAADAASTTRSHLAESALLEIGVEPDAVCAVLQR